MYEALIAEIQGNAELAKQFATEGFFSLTIDPAPANNSVKTTVSQSVALADAIHAAVGKVFDLEIKDHFAKTGKVKARQVVVFNPDDLRFGCSTTLPYCARNNDQFPYRIWTKAKQDICSRWHYLEQRLN